MAVCQADKVRDQTRYSQFYDVQKQTVVPMSGIEFSVVSFDIEGPNQGRDVEEECLIGNVHADAHSTRGESTKDKRVQIKPERPAPRTCYRIRRLRDLAREC